MSEKNAGPGKKHFVKPTVRSEASLATLTKVAQVSGAAGDGSVDESTSQQ
jgi:hypothetical protein